MKENFYPRPSSPRRFVPVHPREVLPLREPPPSLLLYPPILPPEAQLRVDTQNAVGISRADTPISDEFAFSIHVVPAAYPRVTPFVRSPLDAGIIHSDDANLSKEERREKVKDVTDEILDLKTRQINGAYPTDERENRVLWNCVNRYFRKSYPTDVASKGIGKGKGKGKSITLLLLHANGFTKESWEIFSQHLISSIETTDNGSVSVDEIWAFEETQHGDSALINQDKLSAIYDWSDNSRDILNFLTRYLPSRDAAFSSVLPVHLPRVSYELERARLQNGFSDEQRTLVAVGHSLGGATVTLTALTAPRLFTALVLIDPTIVPPYIDRAPIICKLALGAVQRRHSWSSREEARKLFTSSPFFAAWDPEVLDNYVQFGLTPVTPSAPSSSTSSQAVKLKMPGIQEAATFAESRVSREIFQRLENLDPRIAVHWIMAGRGSWITGSEAATRDLVWRRPVNSTNTQVDSEHLIVQQAPEVLAREVHEYLEWLFTENGKARL